MGVIFLVLSFLAPHFLPLMPFRKPQLQGGGMHPEDLMKPDLLSRALLLGGGVMIVVALLMIVLAAFMPAGRP